MDWQKLIIDALNSNGAVALIASIGLFLLGKLQKGKPEVFSWLKKYEGAIISGIKQAEILIPDDTENKSLKKLDLALEYIIRVIEQAEQRKLSEAEKAEIENAVSAKHDEMA